MKITRPKLLAAALAAVLSLGLFVPIGGAQPYYQQISGSIVTALTQFRAAAGSSAVPSYSFTADPDTGLKSSAANVVGLVVGGVERFTFGSGGFGLKGSTSGTLTLAVPAAVGTVTLTLPAGTTDFSGTGGTSQVVKQTSSGGAFTVARLACSDLSNSTSACSTSLGTGVATALGLSPSGSGGLILQSSPTIVTPTISNGSTGDVFNFTATGGRTGYFYSDANLLGLSSTSGLGGSYDAFYCNVSTHVCNIGAAGGTVIAASSTGAAVTGTLTASAIASSGAAQSGYLCYNTSGGVITYDGGATCLVSREEYKSNRGAIQHALDTVMRLKPFWGAYKLDSPMADHRVQPFLGARHTASIDERLVSVDKKGEPLGVRYDNMSAVLIAALQEQQAQIVELRSRLNDVKAGR